MSSDGGLLVLREVEQRLGIAGRLSACIRDPRAPERVVHGHKARRDNRSVSYYRVPRLLEALALARGDGRYGRLLETLGRVQLLILDDWGLAPLTSEQRRDLPEIMDDRHERGSTIVASQVRVDHWHEVIGDPTIADAVLDRLVHNAHRLLLKGESLRKRAANALMLDAEAVN